VEHSLVKLTQCDNLVQTVSLAKLHITSQVHTDVMPKFSALGFMTCFSKIRTN